MDKVQSSRLRMFAALVTALQEHIDTLGVASLEAKLALLIDRIAQIYLVAQIQTQPTRARTERRDELMADMIGRALDLANVAAAHANENNRTELAKLLDINPTAFERRRIPHRPILAQQIHDAVQPVLAELAPLGVTVERLADLQAQIDLVKTWLDQPRSIIREKAAATARLAELFRETDRLIAGQIDKLVFPLRTTHPGFHAAYQLARKIPDTSVRRGGEVETTLAATSAQPVAHAA